MVAPAIALVVGRGKKALKVARCVNKLPECKCLKRCVRKAAIKCLKK